MCKVEADVQKKAKLWMNNTWEQEKGFNKSKVCELQPINITTNITMHIHYSTLIETCRPGILKELMVNDVGYRDYNITKDRTCLSCLCTMLPR